MLACWAYTPVNSSARDGKHLLVLCICVNRIPPSASRWRWGVSISDP